ncbi:inositol monophosphatase [Gluconacetobacter entanii]|uniref:inositol monophosphatase family protein n=1 Tax=Gluconacetobacter entanii TaxID=108528 RepID=UPI001C932058|nr:inositol monophosphatase family protein [Gluconacetobacter entanii]MBY4641415.1 inositol monophosphatase [Gluconacetobacter entanii]MCW4580974.1 inositol monophosphatase [Gluconacetobacter entanii]MCW4583399.1 inositol monophosphatase [Gluconacetobacter entanii]MCW4587605.1 inositol monophosphatase [Gluconacetobacter entanii]
MSNPILCRFEAARSVVRDAAALAMKMRPAPGGPQATQKAAQDWLTETDGAVEALISQRIGELFPEDGFQGEEEGRTRTGSLRWVVDPIDGTSNYARGRNRWCISLGLMDGDTPVAGIIEAPALRETYTAVRGHGAFLNGQPIHASPVSDPATSLIEMGWSNRVGPGVFQQKIDAILGLGAMPRSGGSGAIALAEVACGRQDGYLEMSINLWDVAAALILLEEAGARVSPFLRDGGLDGDATILAAAPNIADALSRAVGVSMD